MEKYLRKVKYLLLIIIVAFSFNACTSDEEDSPELDLDYQIVFWSDFVGEPIDVYIDDRFIGRITSVGTSAPDCDSSGNVTFVATPGKTYKLYAKEDSNSPLVWRGDITMPEVSCYKYNLHN